MKFLIKILIVIFFTLFLAYPARIFADENFDISYDFFYQFLESGNTRVSQTTTLTNKKTNLYPTEFEAIIFGNINSEVQGFDALGNLPLSVSKISNEKTKINIKFNQKSVGIGNKLTFTLNYELKGLLNKIGRINEVVIPKPGENFNILNYNVKISVPKTYGQIAFIKPKKSYYEDNYSYFFNFNYQEAKNGVVLSFGDLAHYKFKLTYHLKNNSLIEREQEIAIPPDTRFQQVIYESITPKPVNVIIDKDDNWIAIFNLMPKQAVDVVASGSILVYPHPREDFQESKPQPQHLQPNKYWEVGSPKITEIAEKLSDPEKIYNFIVENLKYDYSQISNEHKRLGAENTLINKPSVTCMEFTDSFISLSRTKGIPAREINGFAYTQDELLKPLSLVSDILHSWPEYWDSNTSTWVSIDPTWGNTSGLDYFNNLDFYHLVFVRHGISSTYPLSPGSYKQKSSSKDVEIEVEENLPDIPENQIDFNVEIPKKILSNREETITLTIENRGGLGKFNLPIEIDAPFLKINLETSIVNLPAFGKKNITAKIISKQRKVWAKVPITITVGTEKKTVNLDVQPIEFLYLPLFLFGFLGSLLILLILFFKKRHDIRKKT